MITGMENLTNVTASPNSCLLVKTKSGLASGIYLGMYTLKIYTAENAARE